MLYKIKLTYFQMKNCILDEVRHELHESNRWLHRELEVSLELSPLNYFNYVKHFPASFFMHFSTYTK